MSAIRGIMVLVLDLLAALSLMGSCIMFAIGLSAGGGQWKLSLIPLLAALVFQLSSRLYDLVLRRLHPRGPAAEPVAATGLPTGASRGSEARHVPFAALRQSTQTGFRKLVVPTPAPLARHNFARE